MVTAKDISLYISANHAMSKKACEDIVKDIFELIASTLETGDSVNIEKFGKFTISERAARAGRNPKTGESLMISKKRSVKFKASSRFKAGLNEEDK